METQKQQTGKWGETYAVEYLSRRNYEVIEKNYRTRMGEIDIIAYQVDMRYGKTLTFIEVKTRTAGVYDGAAGRAVGREKRQRIEQVARQYCLEHQIDVSRTPIQFEQVSIYRQQGGSVDCRVYVLPA